MQARVDQEPGGPRFLHYEEAVSRPVGLQHLAGMPPVARGGENNDNCGISHRRISQLYVGLTAQRLKHGARKNADFNIKRQAIGGIRLLPPPESRKSLCESAFLGKHQPTQGGSNRMSRGEILLRVLSREDGNVL